MTETPQDELKKAAEKLNDRAEEARVLAGLCCDDKNRQTLLGIADGYESMARAYRAAAE